MPIEMSEGTSSHTQWKAIRFHWTTGDSGEVTYDFFCYGQIALVVTKPGGQEARPPSTEAILEGTEGATIGGESQEEEEEKVQAKPPQAGYHIVMEDEDSIDILNGACRERSATEVEFIEPLIGQKTYPIAVGRHLIRISDAGAGTSGLCVLYLMP
jgi:hypothetical protein